MTYDTNNSHWYALQAKPRRENFAEQNLQRQGHTTYLPRVLVRKRRKGKWVDVVEPLFPRYLFVNIDPDTTNTAPIRSTLGVSGLVRFGNELALVPDAVIDFLKSSENRETGAHDSNKPQFQKGEKLEILDGPFAGFEGIFEIEKDEDRVMILINFLGRENKVAIKMNDVSKM